MFAYCSDLVTIYVSNDWTTDALVGTSGGNENLFYNCTSLVGGNGTHFSTTYTHANYEHIDVAGNPGYLTFRNPLMPGDLNGDGVLSIADVTALVDVALGRDATQPYRFNHTAGDIDGDTQITMADVRVLVDMVLGK